MSRTLSVWVLGALVGCKGGYAVEDIDGGPVAGMIGGVEWQMADADVSPSSFDDDLSITLFAEDVEDCGFGLMSDLPMVLFSVPAVVGEYPLSLSLTEGGRTATLVEPPANNNIATEGIIEVSAVSDTEVEIGIVAVIDDANEINGRFTAVRCAEDTF
jgi:hypothetical protein